MGKILWGIFLYSSVVILTVETKRSKSACRNPKRSKNDGLECSGAGYCQVSRRGPDWCDCDWVNIDGISQSPFVNPDTKRLWGNWCQCNPWNCGYEGVMQDFNG